MDEIIELENSVSDDGICKLHLMSNGELNFDALKKYNAPLDASFAVTKEMGVYHLQTSWPLRGPLVIDCEGWPVPKIFVVWNLTGCESVTAALSDAVKCFENIFGQRPGYAFMRTMPKGKEPGVEVDDLMLFPADWMARKCVAVGWLYK